MATTPTAVAAGFVEQTLRFVYDHLGRRVRKEVFGDGSALVSRTETGR
jgi:glutathione synthase/RimK-type ligase-like ATP-grasp enzyme